MPLNDKSTLFPTLLVTTTNGNASFVFVPLDLGHLGPNSFMPTLQLHFCLFWITHMLRCQLISLFNRLHISMSCWRICIFFTLRRWVHYFLLIFTIKKSHFTEKINQWHWDLSLYMIKDRLTILLYLYIYIYAELYKNHLYAPY